MLRYQRQFAISVLIVLASIMSVLPALGAKEHAVLLDRTLSAMERYYWDTGYRGLDWKLLAEETRQKVEQAPTLEKAMGEVAGMLTALKDHHTRLESPGLDDMSAQDVYGGIGCILNLRTIDGYCGITEVFQGSPAQEMGLEAGDRIWAVNGKAVKDFVTENIHPVTAIRGKEGTPVTITVERKDGQKTDITLVRRQIIREKVAESKKHGDNGEIGYIAWDNFFDKVSEKVADKLEELKDTKGLIVDMRGNPGGLIRELVRIAAYLGVGDLGKSVSRDGVTNYNTWWVSPIYTKPLMFLVDGNTASAAEILSTVAQESGRATLVGQPTSNGTAAAISFPIGEGYKLNVTTAKFYTPKGRPYEAPTKPDVELAEPSDDDYRQGKDIWLDKAVELMKVMVTEKAVASVAVEKDAA